MAEEPQMLFDIGQQQEPSPEKKITVNVKKTTYERRVPKKKTSAPALTLEERLRGGTQARDEAIAHVTTGMNQEWFDYVLAITKAICEQNQTFASFDIQIEYERRTDANKPVTGEWRAAGAVMKTAQSKGWCAPTDDFVPTPIREHHQAPKRVWRSLIFKGVTK